MVVDGAYERTSAAHIHGQGNRFGVTRIGYRVCVFRSCFCSLSRWAFRWAFRWVICVRAAVLRPYGHISVYLPIEGIALIKYNISYPRWQSSCKGHRQHETITDMCWLAFVDAELGCSYHTYHQWWFGLALAKRVAAHRAYPFEWHCQRVR